MKRLLLVLIILTSPIALHAQACVTSNLSDCAASMSPGTWAHFFTPESTLTSDMIGPEDGGINYTFNGQWDSQHHLGYLWSGVHANSGNVCFSNLNATGLSTTMAGDTTITKAGGDLVFDSTNSAQNDLRGKTMTISGGSGFMAGTYTISSVTDTTHLVLATSPTPSGAGTGGNGNVNAFDNIKCATYTQRFLRYNDAMTQFEIPTDTVTGYKNTGNVQAEAGGHPDELVMLDTTTGDVYKVVDDLWRFSFTGQTWNKQPTNMVSILGGGLSQYGFTWFPETNGAIVAFGQNVGTAKLWYLPRGGSTWQQVGGTGCSNCSPGNPLTWGQNASIALYNPIRHEVLVGSGGSGCTGPSQTCDNAPDSVLPRTYNILTYNAGTFTMSADKTIPYSLTCNNASLFAFDVFSTQTVVTVNPVSGNYIVITRDNTSSCTPIMYEFKSTDGSFTELSGSDAPPGGNDGITWPGATFGGQQNAFSIPEYGVIMYVAEKPAPHVWLYKPRAAGGGNPPTTPANLVTTGKSATTVELMWNAATPGAGRTLSGYHIYDGGVFVGNSVFPILNVTGLAINSNHSFTVAAYEDDGTVGTQSSMLSVSTDTALLSYAQKCALSGVLICDGLDDAANLKYYWDRSTTRGGAGSTNPCTALITDSLGLPNYVDFDPTLSNPGNTQAIVNWDAAGNPTCYRPFIDTTVKHSGNGSMQFPQPSHCGVPCAGEYYGGAFHKYANDHFGFVAPQATPFPCSGGTGWSIYCNATHLGDVLWMQWYLRADTAFLSTAYTAKIYSGQFQTASGGTSVIDLYHCGTEQTAMTPANLGINIGDGTHNFFAYGFNNGFTAGQYHILSLSMDGCHITVDRSPTPSMAGGTYPDLEDGFIDGAGTGNTEIKNLGVFGDPPHHSCCLSAFQAATDQYQQKTVSMYSYGPGGTFTYKSLPMTFNGVTQNWDQTRPGCSFVGGGPDLNGTTYSEPPCIRYHANQWQEYTMRLDLGANGFVDGCNSNGHYTLWVDGQVANDRNDFEHCWGNPDGADHDLANGLGQFNFSNYMTGKDPNQDYPAGKWWIDDIIVMACDEGDTSCGIPMLAGDTLPPELTLNTTSLPNGVNGVAYSQMLNASGGTPPYAWTITVGSLPTGLSLDSVFGSITGTPTVNGLVTFTATVTDALMATSDAALSITINPVGSPTITSTSPLPSGTVGTAYSQSVTATGGTTPYAWSVLSGTFPAGLVLATTGTITGTPTVSQTFQFTLRVTDAMSVTADKAFTLDVASVPTTLAITTMTLPDGAVSAPYSQQLVATGGTPPYFWDISGATSNTTLGYNALGANTTSFSAGFIVAAGPFTATTGGTATAAHIRCGSTGGHFTIGVYGGDTINPGSLLFQTADSTACTGADSDVSIPISGLIVPNRVYRIAVANEIGLNDIHYDGPAAGRGLFAPISYSGGNLPLTFPVPSTIYGYDFTIYLDVLGDAGTSGTLPPGLSLNSNGLINGIPSIATTNAFTVRVTDAAEGVDTQDLTLQIRGRVRGLRPGN